MGLNRVWLVFTVDDYELPNLRSVHQTKEGAVSYAKHNYIDSNARQTSELCWRNSFDTVYVSQEDVEP
jgi:hypothetical protein